MNHLKITALCSILAVAGFALVGCDHDDHSDADWMNREGSGTNHHTLQDRSGTSNAAGAGAASINGDASGGMNSGVSGNNGMGSLSGGAAAGSMSGPNGATGGANGAR